MIGIVLVTHGRLADEMLAAAVHVAGPQEQARTVCIGPDDATEKCRRDIAAAVDAVDDSDGVVLLTDLFGGNPSIPAIPVPRRSRVTASPGLNPPPLVNPKPG